MGGGGAGEEDADNLRRAVWAYGDNWPYGGEIDIIEGVNTAHQSIISAHTAEGCSLSPSLDAQYKGTLRDTECNVDGDNVGCGFNPQANDTSSYGDGFNAAGGGVYAMLWDSHFIKIWHFARDAIPSDITIKRPDPRKWTLPDAVFGGSTCAVDRFFKSMRLVINTVSLNPPPFLVGIRGRADLGLSLPLQNFCGDYGNAVWGKTDQCNNFAPTCPEYVAKNPHAFSNAYWDVRYIEAYQLSNGRNPAWPRPTTTVTASVPSRTASVSSTASTASSASTKPASSTAPSLPSIPSVPRFPPAANPSQVHLFANLGCFGSSSGFPTFDMVLEEPNMTIQACVEACHGKTLAGILESRCYCAEELDSDTRAMSSGEDDGGVCDRPCPGNGAETCGGDLERPYGSPAKRGLSQLVHPIHDGTSAMPNGTGVDIGASGTAPACTASARPSSAGTGVHIGAAAPATLRRRRLPSNYLLTVYGDVFHKRPVNIKIPAPPPMAPIAAAELTYPDIATVTALRTEYPLQPSAVAVAAAGNHGCDDAVGDADAPSLSRTAPSRPSRATMMPGNNAVEAVRPSRPSRPQSRPQATGVEPPPAAKANAALPPTSSSPSDAAGPGCNAPDYPVGNVNGSDSGSGRSNTTTAAPWSTTPAVVTAGASTLRHGSVALVAALMAMAMLR